MTDLSKTFLALLATALISCGLFSQQAQAAPVTGEVLFSGTTVVDAARTTFLSFSDVFVLSATGDYAGSEGSAVMMNGFQYNPFTASATPMWTFMFGGTTFSFDLNTATVTTNSPTLISLSVSGILFASGALNRDPTPVLFDFTATQTDGFYSEFRFTEPVPEPGTVALALLGIALVGLKALRRERAAV